MSDIRIDHLIDLPALRKEYESLTDELRNVGEVLKLKAYVYEGKGHYLGAQLVLLAQNKAQAEAMAKQEFEKNGLQVRDTDRIKELPIREPGVLFFNNGDY